MKVSLSWLNELVDIHCDVEELADSLSMAGFEVEELIDLSASLEGIVTGYVIDISPHPNADKLSVCKVDIGKSEAIQIVCGAKNIRSGIHVLVATEGTYLKDIDLTIKTSHLRGQISQGMICSLSELGLPPNNDGIAILEEMNIAIPKIGVCPKKQLGLDEIIFDLAITANRPDGLSMVGIAREVSAINNTKLKLPAIDLLHKDYKEFDHNVESKKFASRNEVYSLNLIDNLNGNNDSSEEVKSRLRNAGINSINAIVDLTNYTMLEQGQPLHAFDADLLCELTGKEVTINDFGIRKAKTGENLIGIDGIDYSLSSKVDVITCSNIIIAIAGIIGGKNSCVNKETRKIWLEAALFSPSSVRISSREIGKRTESSTRFEKGISPEITISSVERCLNLLTKTFDCQILEKWINRELVIEEQLLLLRREKINKTLGKVVEHKTNINAGDNSNNIDKSGESQINTLRNIDDHEIEQSLISLGCKLQKDVKGWLVEVPANRKLDLKREIDLIEEISRLIGYDRFDSNLPNPLRPGGLTPKQKIERKVRESLTSVGFQEVVTLSLVAKDQYSKNQVAISNPLLSETSHLRTNLWQEHLNICQRNMAYEQKGCWIYEIGKIYNIDSGRINETSLLCGALVGNKSIGQWQTETKNSSLDYFQSRGILHSALNSLNINITDEKLDENQLLHPGKSSMLKLEGKELGFFGKLHPSKLSDLNIDYPIYIFELNFNLILQSSTRKNKLNISFKQFPTVPSMERDIALLVDNNIQSLDISNLIIKTGRPLVEDAYLIDRYEGDNIPKGKVSQAFRIRYRKNKDTLKEEEVSPIHDKIREKLKVEFSAELRS
ncbi:phenylalanine--tRNA ligase subunit beta [Prochlorococcus marinus]|uniref:phenylalanine--tRNA ligase subunit beta n=1 Tax=Prochlorococcus marinus TaxID=1219 RepID=UPI0039A60A45